MRSKSDIESQMKNIANWHLITNKEYVLTGLRALLQDDEKVENLMDGLYQGIKIEKGGELTGVLCITDRRLVFVTIEEQRPRYEEILFTEIRGIDFARKYSSVVVTIRLGRNTVRFKSFMDLGSVRTFVTAIKTKTGEKTDIKEGQGDDTSEGIGRLFDNYKTINRFLEKINDLKKTVDDAPDTKLVDEITHLNFLFIEARRIFSEISSNDLFRDGNLKQLFFDDIIILSSLSAMVDGKTGDLEFIFISLVLLAVNIENAPEKNKLRDEIYSFDKASFSIYRTMRTSNFSITFHFPASGTITSVCINLKEDATDAGPVSQFPFNPGYRTTAEKSIILTKSMKDRKEIMDMLKTEENLDADYEGYYFDSYSFSLFEEMDASLDMTLINGIDYVFLLLKDEGVTNADIEVIDTKSSEVIATEEEETGSTCLSHFYMPYDKIIYGKLKIKNVISEKKHHDYPFRLVILSKNLDMEAFLKIRVPDEYEHQLDSMHFVESMIYEVIMKPGENFYRATVSLRGGVQNMYVVVAENRVKDVELDLLHSNTYTHLNASESQPELYFNFLPINAKKLPGSDEYNLRIKIGQIDNPDLPLRLKIFQYYQKE